MLCQWSRGAGLTMTRQPLTRTAITYYEISLRAMTAVTPVQAEGLSIARDALAGSARAGTRFFRRTARHMQCRECHATDIPATFTLSLRNLGLGKDWRSNAYVLRYL